MFAKIPQSLSFSLLGDDAKLAFRNQSGGIAKLASTRNIPQSDSYWDQYVLLFDSASDVFSLITPHDVRRALLEAPENITTLIRVITSKLFNLISDHTFPTPASSPVSSYASSFIKSSTRFAGENTTKEVLNCLRVLQRVLPVVFEVDGETGVFELDVFWKEEQASEDLINRNPAETSLFVIEDEEGNEDDPEASNLPKHATSTENKQRLLPLGERLFNCLIDLLFCCGFTLPTKIQVDHYKINYFIWEKGVGSTSDPGPSQAYDSNKVEVLRLLLVLLSRQIYIPSSSLLTKPSRYTLHLVQKRSRRDVLTILCSLLNTAMNSGCRPIGGMTGKLPYNHLVFKGEDPRSTLTSICFQMLCVLLDFQSGSARDTIASNGDVQTSAPTAYTNLFRYFFMKLHRTQDFALILEGTAGILEQQIRAMHHLLPGAKKSIPYFFELVILFWKMIELNKKFRVYVLESDRATDILAYLLFYCVEIKDKPQQHGLCRALSYIMQTLSAESAFGLKLSSPVKVQLPIQWNSAGTAADFLINAVYGMVATTSGALNSLYPALIITLANAAPYFKSLNVTSSTRLIQLFTSFSSPLFLLADEGHPRLLFFMLEVFNSVIQHNLSENPNLIYAILSAHKTFEDLGTFTLSRGLHEVRRMQMTKEEQERSVDGMLKPRSHRDGGVEDDTQDEKARLVSSQNVNDVDLERGQNVTVFPLEESPKPERVLGGSVNRGLSDSHNSITGIALPSEAASAVVTGKMKERRSTSLDTTSNIDRIVSASIGRNGFVPTEDWVASWQQGLPLDTIMLLITELLPKIQDLQLARHRPGPAPAVMDLLRTVTLKHILPPAPPLTPRRFQWSDASMAWLTSLIWGEIYVRGMAPLAIWNSTNVRLFHVKHTQTPPRQITDTVSDVVGGFLGRSTSSDSFGGRRTERMT